MGAVCRRWATLSRKMVQVYVDHVIDRISSKSKAWAGFTIVLLLFLFVASCMQANVSTAQMEGNTEIMPNFQCGQWLRSEREEEWGLSSPGEYNNPYGIEYDDGESSAEWECGWPTANSVYRLLTLSLCLVASGIHVAALFGLSCTYTTPALLPMYFIGFFLLFGSACVDCNQIRIGAAVCEAHLAEVIKSTKIESMECDNGIYVATAAGGFVASISMYISFYITKRAASTNELQNTYEEAALQEDPQKLEFVP